MSIASALAYQARTGARLTQNELARLADVHQPAVARAESGHTDLTVSSLDRLVSAAGWRLTVVPTRATTAADTAEVIANLIGTASVDGPFRAIIQLADDLAAEHGAERVALTVTPPQPTGDIRFDALLAGVVETRLDEQHLPHPRWLATAQCLSSPWFVDNSSVGDAATIAATPSALAKRGVIIDADELMSL